MSIRSLAGAALALAWFGSATAAEPVAVVTGPGDQSAPSISDGRIAYLDGASGTDQVWVRALDTGTATRVSVAEADHGAPDLAGATVAFAGPDGLHLVTLVAGGADRLVPAAGAARASLSGVVVAWEQAGPGGRDVAVMPLDAVAPVIVSGAGDEHAPATAFGWVAWLDEAGEGAIRLRSDAGAITAPWTGRAAKVSLWAPNRLAAPLLAAAVDGAAGQDLVVLEASGAERARLALPGTQQNPTLHGEWVGFEDLASGVPQVAVWQWSTGRVVYPSPSGSAQLLNDVIVDGTELKVAWADARGGDLDLFLFRAALPLPDVPPGEVRCDDPLAPVVADLSLTAGPEGFAINAIAVDVPAPTAALVCVDGVNAVAAWTKVADTVVELPYVPGTGPGPGHPGDDDDHGHWHHDHGRADGHDGGHLDRGRHRGHKHHRHGDPCEPAEPILRHAEASVDLPAGAVPVAGFLAGWPGATLRVRVLADGWRAPARTGCLPGVDCPVPPAGLGGAEPGTGCSSGGAFGLTALLLAPALLALRLRRRRA